MARQLVSQPAARQATCTLRVSSEDGLMSKNVYLSIVPVSTASEAGEVSNI